MMMGSARIAICKSAISEIVPDALLYSGSDE